MSELNIKTARVVIYTTLRCPHCQHLKRWLKKNKVPFLDFNVGKPGKMQKKFFEIGGQSVPLILIGEQQFVGFNPNQLKSALLEEGLILDV
ncbi:MAG: NrdH-redoxin [Candidatus Thiodiazotropha sp.]|nr:NrdH-redoxin [Candidatus Thiodiazotropha sp.]MCU7805884.1 NrdH-redoxin [Candidatus Thiodiazotropha sp. (ex Lucinoma borealis)]MCU7838606.1 NrdH-redoxin [Candidatus Thiodiazotropha sp. (ex Troendleina suluensis)]MCU7883074.1 NrdH-redoxin [Candidatus Thiodiazotropha sp. (ex Lucinoma annulata)]MCM8883150.1 NrdH-redoxin [Candidatus Thiodiazotropha sp.]